jgi:hypothetical protein
MTSTLASLTTATCGLVSESSEAVSTRLYRLRKAFAAVQFDPAGRGRIVFLPEGAELCITGGSCVSECLEVMHEDQLYNIFKVDLLGPWSTPIKPTPIKPTPLKTTSLKTSRLKPMRGLAVVGACA